MTHLPQGWSTAAAGNLGTLRLGKMLDRARNQGEPTSYLRNVNVRWFRFDLDDLLDIHVTPEEARHLAVQDGDVFICEGGEPGRCAVWKGGDRGLVFQKALHRFRSNGAILPELLVYWLRALAETGELTQYFTGTTIKHLTGESLTRLQVRVPPVREQLRIVNRLDSLLARINACRQRLDRVPDILKRFRMSVLAAATSGELTREWREERALGGSWPVVTLESVATGFSYGSAAKSSKSGRVPVLRMGNIQDGRLDWEDLVFTSDADEIGKYRLSPGDVLFNRTNSPELVGKTAIFGGEREAIYAGYLIRVRCGEKLLPDFLNYCLGSPAGRDYCWQVKSDGVSQSNINATKLAAFTFGLPNVGEQQEIVRRVEDLLAASRALESCVRRTSDVVASLVSAVLGKAFRGELVPQDPNDEPASVMLERLRAKRDAVGAEKNSRPRNRTSSRSMVADGTKPAPSIKRRAS